MSKIIQAVRYGVEMVFIYLYFSLAVVVGGLVCLVLSLFPKKPEETFTFDGYDL